MYLLQVWQQLVTGLQQTTWPEYVAVIAGIASVIYSRAENILVYPVGLISTIIYVYLSFKYQLIGEASVNFYYTVMSIWGWYLWSRKDKGDKPLLRITFSNAHAWGAQLLFFAVLYLVIYAVLTYLKTYFYPGVIAWADAFASATAFTGMWLMAKKKVESWYWWLLTNAASIPLYFVKGLVVTSLFYIVLFVIAITGLKAWYQKAKLPNPATT